MRIQCCYTYDRMQVAKQGTAGLPKSGYTFSTSLTDLQVGDYVEVEGGDTVIVVSLDPGDYTGPTRSVTKKCPYQPLTGVKNEDETENRQ